MKSRKVKATARSRAYMKKLKSTIPLEKEEDNFDINQDEDSLDEDEHYENEDSSSEEEVLPISEGESEDDAENEEISDAEEDLPGVDNWGKKKSVYFNADFVDKDRGKTYRDEDLELENEEREAVILQQQAAAELDKYESSAYYENYDRINELILKKDPKEAHRLELNDIDNFEAERLEQEQRKYPKFKEYKEKFTEKFAEVNKLGQLIELAEKSELNNNFIHYIKLKYQISLHYLLNLSFYMYLKNSEDIAMNHPIYERIEQFKNLDEKMNNKNYYKQIDEILEKLKRNQEVDTKLSKNKSTNSSKKKRKQEGVDLNNIKSAKKQKKSFQQFETEEEKEILALYKDMKENKQHPELSEDGNEEEHQNLNSTEENVTEKRTITRQIAKNRGLAPRRKKEHRNPRVHHRMKFRKAIIRRKGQVKGVVKEIKKYHGEPTGISSHVVRSTKMK